MGKIKSLLPDDYEAPMEPMDIYEKMIDDPEPQRAQDQNELVELAVHNVTLLDAKRIVSQYYHAQYDTLNCYEIAQEHYREIGQHEIDRQRERDRRNAK